MLPVFALSVFITLLCVIYVYLKSCYSYWKVRKIPHLKPSLFFGNAYELCVGKKSMLEFQKDIYAQMKRNKLLGIYMFQKPTLYIGDIEWIKSILIQDFSYFCDRGLKFDGKIEPLTIHLFHLEGQQWKTLRSKVSPSFVPRGLKVFFPSLIRSANKLRIYFSKFVLNSNDINLKDIMDRYATDVIARCAFGVESDALIHDGNPKLYKMSGKIFSPRVRTIIKLIFPRLPNFLTEFFDIKMIATEVSQYFIQIIQTEMEFRFKNGEEKDDFLGYLINVQKNDFDRDDIALTDQLIIAQCFMFFIAGFENISSVLCSALFELAANPKIQEKLFDEVHNCFINENLNINFEKLHEMIYLDMVVSEVIRLYPPATALIRECKKNYNLPNSDIIIEKGTQIVIPICGIHTDSRYFPYADTFNPENFSDEAKLCRNRYAYSPFGDGPRSCIGKKFGNMLIKVALIMFVSCYKFYPSSRMILPLTFEKKTFVTNIKGGIWIRCESRL